MFDQALPYAQAFFSLQLMWSDANMLLGTADDIKRGVWEHDMQSDAILQTHTNQVARQCMGVLSGEL